MCALCKGRALGPGAPHRGRAPAEVAGSGGTSRSTDDERAEPLTKVRQIWDQLRGPDSEGWPQLGQNSNGQNLTPVDAIAAIKDDLEHD